MPIIEPSDRIAALEIAYHAERDALDRAERAGNIVAAKINRLRCERAEKRLSDARLSG